LLGLFHGPVSVDAQIAYRAEMADESKDRLARGRAS